MRLLLFLMISSFSTPVLGAPSAFHPLRSWINSKDCAKSDTLFLACTEALSAYASNDTSYFVVWPLDLALPTALQPAKLIQSLAPLGLYRATQPNFRLSPFQEWKMRHSLRSQIQQQLLSSYSKLTHTIDFEDLFNSINLSLSHSSEKQKINLEIQAINAFLSISQDPHTYLRSKEDLEAGAKSQESYAGIGISTETDTLGIVIAQVFPNSPAFKAGLWHGDRILAYNHQAIDLRNAAKILDRIRGPVNSTVELQIQRQDSTFKVNIRRQKISLPNLSSKQIGPKGKWLYLKLNSFEDHLACEQVYQSLQKSTPSTKGIILDLRDNSGGLINQATCIAGLFVGPKLIAFSKDLQGKLLQNYKAETEQVTQLPMITLINSNSASASELLSGTLQYYQRSWILGSPSFGKGTVQVAKPWSRDLYFFQTEARYFLPSGLSTQLSGIKPDFELPEFPDKDSNQTLTLREKDLYSNALSPKAPPIEPERTSEALKLKQCTHFFQPSLQDFSKQLYHQPLRPDFLLLAAQDLLNCELPLRKQ